jgi:predicted amidophosphoribosyltransferase
MHPNISRILAIFEDLFDTILPLRARAARTKKRSLEHIPLMPTPHELLGTRVTTLMDYRNSEVHDLVQSLKYDKSGHAAQLCADALADYLREEIASNKSFSPRKIILVPMPLHKKRVRERGYNQIGIVLSRLPRDFQNGTLSTLTPHLLERSRETRQQTRLPRHERLSNVAGAFHVTDVDAVKDAHIYLIDDVTTTGATLVHAGRPLRAAGALVSLLALARA